MRDDNLRYLKHRLIVSRQAARDAEHSMARAAYLQFAELCEKRLTSAETYSRATAAKPILEEICQLGARPNTQTRNVEARV